MAHQYHSCQVKWPLGVYPEVEEHGVQQDFLKQPYKDQQSSILGCL